MTKSRRLRELELAGWPCQRHSQQSAYEERGPRRQTWAILNSLALENDSTITSEAR